MHLLKGNLLKLCLISTYFVCSASASGIYLDAFTRHLSRMADKHEDLKDKFKSLSIADSASTEAETEAASSNSTESNPIKTNGASLPPIEENPHLEEIDEKYSLCNGVDVRELTILQIQDLFDKNVLTSEALTRCYMDRIEMTNEVLRSVNELNPNALLEARKADVERKMGVKNRGPMHGIPVLIKENIATFDGMETTAGSLALLGIRPKSDADVVKALRKSGAVILGKANLSEFAFFRGTNLPSGWSGRGNQTRNAYNLNVTPEGSSSGSAVTVSANLCVVSVGTETDGSLIAPSSIAGICTIKPTLGTPSIKGIIPISHNQDNAGPMARTVMDLAIALDAMIPEEERNPKQPKSFAECVQKRKEGSRAFRIGVMRHPFFNTSAINSTNLEGELDQLNEFIEVLKNSVQFEMLDPASPDIEFMKALSGDKELLILTHDFKHDFNEYLRTEVISAYPIFPSGDKPTSESNATDSSSIISEISQTKRKISTLKDVIEFNEENPALEGYNQELLIMSEATDGLQNETYIKARDENRAAAKGALDSVLEKFNLDAVMTPSESRYERILDEELKDSSVVGYSLAAIAGYPSINIPAGIGLKNVPFGVTFIGVPYSEATLLQIGYAVEQISRKRTRPKFLI